MSNTYTKKYEMGEMKVDLPYNSCIYELPLLSFADMRHSINLSLVYNQRLDEDFGIVNHFKLNLQKKIMVNEDDSLSFCDSDGKIIDLAGEGDIYTFSDDSMRIIRYENSGYTLENPDGSKELYSLSGYPSEFCDKYNVKILEYGYSNRKLSFIKYFGANEIVKTININFNSNIVSINFNSSSSSSTVIYYNQASSQIEINHYSGVYYELAWSNFDFTVNAKEGYDQEALYSKSFVRNATNPIITITDYVGTNSINSTEYKFPSCFVENSISKYNQVEITDKYGVTTRVHYFNDKPIYSYEVSQNMFDSNSKNINTVNIYKTFSEYYCKDDKYYELSGISGSVEFSEVQTKNDGEYMSYYGNTDCWSNDADLNSAENGYYLLTGWVKLESSGEPEVLVKAINNSYEKGFKLDSMPACQWTYFACVFKSNHSLITASVSNAETCDFRLKFYPSEVQNLTTGEKVAMSEAIFIHKNSGEVTSINGSTLKYDDGNEEDTPSYSVTFEDLLKCKINAMRSVNPYEFYSDRGQSICDISRVKINGQANSFDNYYIGKRSCISGRVYTTVYKEDATEKTMTVELWDNEGFVCQYKVYNEQLDVIEENNGDAASISYLRSETGLITEQTINGHYSTTIAYSEDARTATYTDEFGNQTVYNIDTTWGGVESITLPDGSVITNECDGDMSVLERKIFGTAANQRENVFSYSGGNLTSLVGDGLSYEFNYTDGDLTQITKNGADLEENEYGTNDSVTTYYPQQSNSLYSRAVVNDKYGRVTGIDGTLTNTYKIPGTDVNTGSSVLTETIDNAVNEKTIYGYDDKRRLVNKTVKDSATDDVLTVETFAYDKANRLTSATYSKDDKCVESTIAYLKCESYPNADGKVEEYMYQVADFTARTVTGYEYLDRVCAKTIYLGSNLFYKNLYYNKSKLSEIVHKSNNIIINSNSYGYDTVGRISSDWQTYNQSTRKSFYKYDAFGQLIREDNQLLDKTFIYSYNENGNIVSVKSYAYTTNDTPSGSYTEKTYSYDSTHKDRLTGYGGTSISYNSAGLPTTYQGKNLTWNNGRLARMSSGSRTSGFRSYTFTYNSYGVRTYASYSYTPPLSPIVPIQSGEVTAYTKSFKYDNLGRLLYEKIDRTVYGVGNDNIIIDYLYDESSMIGMRHTYGGVTNTYYYCRNMQGDVVAICDINGNVKVRYTYDAWGNCTIASDTVDLALARANPIRYRGYYYDQDTELYYLNSRYYSPVWRRFISPDDTAYLDPESVNGLNLYCYCNNDPVNYADPSGCFPVLAVVLCGIALIGMGLTIGGVASDNNVMTAIGLTMVAIPALISGVGAIFSGATYLSIIGGVTTVAGVGTGMFATAEYQEAFTGNNWMLDAGMSEEWYNGLMLATAAIATAGTIASGVLSSAGNAATPNKMMNSFNKHPNRWKTVKELVEPGRGANKGGISTYSNYINKWTGSKLGIHKIIRSGRFLHGPHFHPWF